MKTKNLKEEERLVQKHLLDNYHERYETPYGKLYQQYWNQALLKNMPQDIDQSVLDLGCGTGFFLKELANRYKSVYGLDISPELINSIRIDSPNLKSLIVGDAEDIAYPDNIFDLVFSRGVLHHLPDPEKSICSVHRKLKKGGWFVVSEPCHDSVLLRLPRKIIVKQSEDFSEIHRAFPSRYLVSLLNEAGFEVKSIERFGFIALPVCGMSDHSKIIRYLPGKALITRFLIGLDSLLSKVPLVRTQAWHVLIRAQKI